MLVLARSIVLTVALGGMVSLIRASADERPPLRVDVPGVYPSDASADDRRIASVRGIVVEGVTVTLDSNQTLKNVQSDFGHSPIVPPRHHDGFWSVCYTVSAKNGTAQLRLLSNELGGDEHTILGFELKNVAVRTSSADANCPAIPSRARGTTTTNGLVLGMPMTDVLRRMGKPSRRSHGAYEFESTESIKPHDNEQGFDISTSLRVEVAAQKVTSLWAWYVKTT